MKDNKLFNFIRDVLANVPQDWTKLTTHRLDIYIEELAKTQFLEEFERLFENNDSTLSALNNLPTAYDYIRLGHPLSCVIEWAIAKMNNLNPENVVSFSSKTMAIMAVLRTNLLDNKKTQIYYEGSLPENFNEEILKNVYGFEFDLKKYAHTEEIDAGNDCTIFVSQNEVSGLVHIKKNMDFFIGFDNELGSILIANGEQNEKYISEIQHVRRRETIAMTPANCLIGLQRIVNYPVSVAHYYEQHKNSVLNFISEITGTNSLTLVGSSGLSIQFAILMGLVHDAHSTYHGKPVKIVVPTNCYGGTNDQARRVAACHDNVQIVDLEVDGDSDMVNSIDKVLNRIADQDAVPFIIAEIPTNPRVEVPDLKLLKEVLSKKRKTKEGDDAIDPVFVLDQTFCPNIRFLSDHDVFSTIKTISFSSGSKFPSGGLCNAGYCVGNKMAQDLMRNIALHLQLCDNEATALQYEILAEKLPSMNKRIKLAYENTREFVDFIKEKLPEAKINFVSEELAAKGFTPSVFSLGLPTKGDTAEEKEAYKRFLNLELIKLMITELPLESKNCVSYGQLKGSYWTIPATSTQGTTKEKDKDYIVRAALSPNMDLERHKMVFQKFVDDTIDGDMLDHTDSKVHALGK